MCSSRKIHTHLLEGHHKFLGGGDIKAKILEAKYEALLEISLGWGGVQNKKPSVGGVRIFSGTTQLLKATNGYYITVNVFQGTYLQKTVVLVILSYLGVFSCIAL